MKQSLTLADFQPLAAKLAADLAAAHDEITALDAATGDGDLGVTCRLGLQAVIESPGEAAGSLADALLKAGMAFNSAGASTFGALVATAAMRAAKVAKDGGLAEWDLAAIVAAGEAAIAGLQQRGGAQQGDKTLLDALIPAVGALKEAETGGASLAEACSAGRSGVHDTPAREVRAVGLVPGAQHRRPGRRGDGRGRGRARGGRLRQRVTPGGSGHADHDCSAAVGRGAHAAQPGLGPERPD